ncbi:MAG: DUF6522 family protein [Steroidobacteraceae bacterium]
MTKIDIEEGAVSIDAAVIAAGFGIEPAQVQSLMKDGRITSVCEKGVDEDAGRHRLTFHFNGRSFRVVADETGQIVASATAGRTRRTRRLP